MDPLVSKHPIIGSVVFAPALDLVFEQCLWTLHPMSLHILIIKPPDIGQMLGIHISWP